MIRAGELNKQVTLLRGTETTGTHNAPKYTFSAVAYMRAKVEPLAGRELLQALQAQAETTYRITIRYRADITTMDRLQFSDIGQTRTLEILSIANKDCRNESLELSCKEVA